MNFLALKKRAAKELNLLDSSEAILTGKDINETKLGQSINDGYLAIATALRSQYPHLFEQETAPIANYSVTGTASASSTGTTLVASSSIFTNAMVGLYVENTTESETAKITAYTSATTVTLDTTIGNDWDGDSIRIIDNTFTFGGDSTDIYAIKWVKARYSSTGEYIKARPRIENDAFQLGYESYSEGAPIYMETMVKVSTTSTRAFKIFPAWRTGIATAVKIKYLEGITELSADGDTPHPAIPADHHPFLMWNGVAEGALQRKDWALHDRAMQKFEQGKMNLLSTFRTTSFDENPGMAIDRSYARIFNSEI